MNIPNTRERKILVLLNPGAGILNPLRTGPRELGFLVKKNLPEAVLIETHSEEEALHAAAKAVGDGFDVIAEAGGDGSARALSEILSGADSALGLIPSGSAGNIARSLSIPTDPAAALGLLRTGTRRHIDTGIVNGNRFIEAGGAGFHAGVLASYGARPVKSLVRTLYSIAMGFAASPSFAVELELDGRKIERQAVQVTVMNLPYYGTGFHLAPGASPTDGLLDVMVIRNISSIEVPVALTAAWLGKLERAGIAERFRAREVKIESDIPIPLHADGFPAGTTPAVFSVNRGALPVIYG